jgi:hypothetical protein
MLEALHTYMERFFYKIFQEFQIRIRKKSN